MDREVTRWQVRVGGEWKSFDLDVVVGVACGKFERPGDVRLATIRVGHGLWFVRMRRTTCATLGINGRRLAAAKKRQRREIENAGLFGGFVASEQASPEAEIERTDRARVAGFERDRKKLAEEWRRARAALRSLPVELQVDVIERWNRRTFPGVPLYLLMIVQRFQARENERTLVAA